MEEIDPHDEIARLEARIEALSQSIELCRTISLISKLAIAGAACWLGLRTFGITTFGPAGYVISIAAMIGGMVLLGSNSSTWNEAEAERTEAEARREELIGRLKLHIVSDRGRLH